jgi:hypothetical protein
MKPPLILFSLFIFFILHDFCQAQPRLHAHAALGYTEHFSLGIGCTFADKHSVTLLYGSNFFFHPKQFSAYMLQYNLAVQRWRFLNVTPSVGIKGGHAIFTDGYYTWEVAVFIPFVAMQYPLSRKIDLVIQTGGAVSFEQKVRRINYGEIGHYRQYLPEVKACIVYNFNKSGQ